MKIQISQKKNKCSKVGNVTFPSILNIQWKGLMIFVLIKVNVDDNKEHTGTVEEHHSELLD